MKRAPVFILALFFVTLLSSACQDNGTEKSSHFTSELREPPGRERSQRAAKQQVESEDWCKEHGVPESKCTKCNPKLITQFQHEGDWCEEHGLPESVCPDCQPTATDTASKRPQGDATDWCGGHAVPESKCTKCNPKLIERFKSEGDWCSEHEFPESVCPICNPMLSPKKDEAQTNAIASDWCNEHGVPESKCTQCNPSLTSEYQSSGDWCKEHKFPESICPICNPMAPPAGASGPQTRVQLTESAFQTSELRLQPVVTRAVSKGVMRIPAEIQFEPGRIAHVSPLVDGQIVRVDVTTGTRVKAGDALATFRSVALGQARAELSRASAVRRTAKAQLKRQQRLRDEKINSRRDLLQAQLAFDEAEAAWGAARSRLRVFGVTGGSGPDMTLTSPIAGVVVERSAVRGGNVSTKDTLFVVADTSKVWVMARAYEQHIPTLNVGTNATLTMASYQGRRWTGTIDYIALSLDEATRTLPVRMPVLNNDGRLRPGMFGTLSIQGGQSKSTLRVPTSAVQSLNGRDVVFVKTDEERTFEARSVTLGREVEGSVPVIEGLSRTDTVVVAGAFILKSELVRGQLADGCAGD